jgi:hypothetical protein
MLSQILDRIVVGMAIVAIGLLCLLAGYLLVVPSPAERQLREDLHICRLNGYTDMYPMHDIYYCYGPGMPAVSVDVFK